MSDGIDSISVLGKCFRRRGYDIIEWSGTRVEAGHFPHVTVGRVGSDERRSFGTLAEAATWVAVAPKVRRVDVRVVVYVETDATDAEISDWVDFHLQVSGVLSRVNPLWKTPFDVAEADTEVLKVGDETEANTAANV